MDAPALTPGDVSCFLQRLAHEPAVWVRVAASAGSVPREVGAWMAVFAHGAVGTIGGGHLEWQVMQRARQCLGDVLWHRETQRQALGPSLGQCCGGMLELDLQRVGVADVPRLRQALTPHRVPVALFGGGHVGSAIVRALAPLPFAVHWIDSRDGIFPEALPPQVRAEHSDPVQRAVFDVWPGSHVLVMSFSHAEDLDIVAACLERQGQCADLPFVGLLGSRTKWATFTHRLQARGHTAAACAHVTCPIGLPGIVGKQPEVIAASVAAQLLMLSAPARAAC